MEFRSFEKNKNILNSNIDYSKLKIFVQNSHYKDHNEKKDDSQFILKLSKENNYQSQNKKFKIFQDLVNPIFEDLKSSKSKESFNSHSNSIKLSEQFGVESSLIMSPRINNSNKINFITNDNDKALLSKTLSLINNSFEEINDNQISNKKLSLKEKLKLKKSKMDFWTPLTTFRSSYNNQSTNFNSNRKFQKIPENIKDYDININNIKNHTTLMIRNIPNKYTQEMMLNLINKKFWNKYDFFYLPIDFQNNSNVGYAFINFKKCKYIKEFYLQFNNKKWECSRKICEIKYARIQGAEEYSKHFKGKTIIKHHDSRFKPLIQKSLDDLQNLVEFQKKNINH